MTASLGKTTVGIALALAAASAGPARAQQRVELPVRLVQLSDGVRRFAVPLTVEGQAIEAGLDTGSTGLRVMARALPGTAANGPAAHYFYGVGTQLDGPLVRAGVALGARAGKVTVQRVTALSCAPAHPQCPARGADPAAFGIQGDGLPGEGFAAILGVNLRDAGAPNPFVALGVRRWIVELPRPGDAAPGRIILDPDAADTAGFVAVHLLGDGNSVPACLIAPAPFGRLCGPAVIDSGAPGLVAVAAHPPATPPAGTAMQLVIGDEKAGIAADLVTERREAATHLIVARGEPRLFLGIAPYWRWSVLYDAGAHTIAFKPR